VRGETGGVYIAGETFGFTQAAGDALRDRAQSPVGEMSVVVLGRELPAVTQQGPAESRALVERLQRAGIPVYVCARDMKARQLTGSDLLPNVRIERGWSQAESQADVGAREVPDDAPPESMLRRVRRLCSEG
jgi:hypothetical protein